jgi:transposase-like protein
LLRNAKVSSMKRRKFSDEEKATVLAILAVNSGNASRTARECGVLRQTINRWKNGVGVNDSVAEMLHLKKRELRDIFAYIAAAALVLLSNRLEECSAAELAIISAKSTDRYLLLEAACSTTRAC